MPGFFQEHLRPLAGSAGLHVALLALLAGAALHWRSDQPPVELAIEGFVTELPPERPAAQSRAAPPAPAPKPIEAPPRPDVPAEPVVEPPQQRRAEEAAAAERAAQAEREQRRIDEQAAQQREAKRAQELAAQQAREQAAAEAKRKATEDEARKKAEAAESRRQAEAQAQAEREAAVRAERESDLARLLAAEEEAAAVARSGVVDEYRLLLEQTIQRNWIRPPSARAGLECTLYVTQAPGGTVVDVRLGTCNGDTAVRESITNAVFRASPLPSPRDARAFQRRLEIVFKPTE